MGIEVRGLQQRRSRFSELKLILVDWADREVLAPRTGHSVTRGRGSSAHRHSPLLILMTDGELLWQPTVGRPKRFWQGFWSKPLCSHPRARGERDDGRRGHSPSFV